MRVIASTVVLISSLGLASTPVHAEKLSDVIASQGADWLIGQWKDASSDGASVSFAWTLDKHVISVRFSSGTTHAHGMIVYRKTDDSIQYVSADNRGATGTGHWTTVDGHPTLIYEHHRPDGKTIKAAFMHRRIDDDTMSIGIYQIVDSGQLAPSPVAEPRFTRVRQ